MELALIPDAFRKDILGEIESNGVLVEDAGAAATPFALLFQFEGDESATRYALYNCVASRPSIAGATTEEGIEAQTETLEFSAASVYNTSLQKDLVKAKAAYSTSTSSAYATWFETVWQPTT